jgi:hypothetical protein
MYADVLTNCLFAGNRAEGPGAGGGAVYNGTTFVNCLFDRNTVDTEMSGAVDAGGAAIFNTNSNDSFLYNCTFSGNTVDDPDLGISVHNNDASNAVLVNCIVWDEGPNIIVDVAGSSTTIDFSDVRGGWTGAGGNNIDADPLFTNAAGGDLRPGPGSPCIDVGINVGVPEGVLTDLDGDPRFADDPCAGAAGVVVVDMGAFEFQGSSAPPSDLDLDCDVDINDFLLLLAAWGSCPPKLDCPGDLDGDGVVGINDLLLLLADWS